MAGLSTYELGFDTTDATGGVVIVEIAAGANKPMQILELNVNAAAAQGDIFFGRPGATIGAGGTFLHATQPVDLPATGGASVGGIYLDWTTRPLGPAAGDTITDFRVASGSNFYWTQSWEPGEMIVDPTSRATSLVLKRVGTTLFQGFVKWLE